MSNGTRNIIIVLILVGALLYFGMKSCQTEVRNWQEKNTERGVDQHRLYTELLQKWNRGESATPEERRAYLRMYGKDPSKKVDRDWFEKIEKSRLEEYEIQKE